MPYLFFSPSYHSTTSTYYKTYYLNFFRTDRFGFLYFEKELCLTMGIVRNKDITSFTVSFFSFFELRAFKIQRERNFVCSFMYPNN